MTLIKKGKEVQRCLGRQPPGKPWFKGDFAEGRGAGLKTPQTHSNCQSTESPWPPNAKGADTDQERA